MKAKEYAARWAEKTGYKAATGRNHGGNLHDPHMWKTDTVHYLELLESGQIPLETWDYLDEEFEFPVQKLGMECVGNNASTLRLEAFASVPPPYSPHDLSVWTCNGGVDHRRRTQPRKRHS